jgi:hypothetical protein
MPLRVVALAVVLAAWWTLSALNQFRSGAWTVGARRYIPLALVPLWTFFAPNPARSDSRLVWRDEVDGRWGAWEELHFGFAPVHRRWLFNPELIENKAVSDLSGALLSLAAEFGPRGFLLTSSYVALLSVLLSQSSAPSRTGIQFAVVRTNIALEKRRLDVAFVSEVHDAREPVAHVC